MLAKYLNAVAILSGYHIALPLLVSFACIAGKVNATSTALSTCVMGAAVALRSHDINEDSTFSVFLLLAPGELVIFEIYIVHSEADIDVLRNLENWIGRIPCATGSQVGFNDIHQRPIPTMR